MQITINSKRLDIEPGMTIVSFLEMRGIKPEMVTVEYNYNLPSKESWSEIVLNENDNLEVIKIIGGG